MEQVKEM